MPSSKQSVKFLKSHLPLCHCLRIKGTDHLEPSRAFERKRQIALSGRIWKYREARQRYKSQRSEVLSDSLKAEVNRLKRLVTRRINEWRNDQWSATLESLEPEDQSLWRMIKRVIRVPTLSPPGGIVL